MTKSRWRTSAAWRGLFVVAALPLSAGGYLPETEVSAVARGREAFARGDYEEAVEAFREATAGDGNSDRLQFNFGTALVQAGLTSKGKRQQERSWNLAIAALRSATDARDAELREKALYNLGNALLLRERYDEAMEAYRQVLRGNPDHQAARHNLELALRAQRKELAQQALLAAIEAVAREPSAQGETPESAQGAASPDAGVDISDAGGDSNSEDGREDPKGQARPPSKNNSRSKLRDMGIQQKLDALEKRSGELRRHKLFKLTEARRKRRERARE